ncbi:transglutaminase domain-containing protein [Dokdonia ponticola]|uniref:Transglutaminase domain-containing protein n=1 Tax=Dokdonia ponticola TaxID=2041041 RepID=A0ABV9HR77_9FLAO
MIKKYIICSVFLLLASVITAQEFKIGKLKKEHFEIPLNSEQNAAPAVFLHKYRNTHFEYRDNLDGWILVTNVHEVVLINSISGFPYATKRIRLYRDGREEENIKKLEAFTYNLVDGKVEKTKTPKESIIENTINKNIKEVSIAMPAVKQGSIVEYEYLIESTYQEIDDVIFQENIPVKNAFAKIEIPQFFDYNKFVKGYLDVHAKEYAQKRTQNFSIEQKNPFGGRTGGSATNTMRFKDVVTEYSLKDIPALKEEPFVNNIENYKVSIVYELAAEEYREGQRIKRAKTWEEVAAYLNNDARVKGQIDRTRFLDEVSSTLKAKADNRIDRIHLAYNFIKDRMTWDKAVNKYRLQDLRKAYNDQSGTPYEINVLLVALLKRMGLDAAPVMASTKKKGIPIFPTVDGFDYAVAAVYHNEEWLLMDASDKNLTPGLLPERIMNWEGRLLKDDGSSMAISLFSKEYSENTSMMIVNIDRQGLLTGKCRRKYTNNEGLYMRNTLRGRDVDYQEGILRGMLDLDEVYDITFDLDELSKPVTISFSFETTDFVEVIDDKMYLSPHLFLIIPENPFKASERKLPIDFRYPRTFEGAITYTIPEGYSVERIPEPLELQLSNGLGSYTLAFRQVNAQSIQVSKSFRSNSTLVAADAYNEIKNFYQQIVTKEKEKVVLKKS